MNRNELIARELRKSIQRLCNKRLKLVTGKTIEDIERDTGEETILSGPDPSVYAEWRELDRKIEDGVARYESLCNRTLPRELALEGISILREIVSTYEWWIKDFRGPEVAS